LQRSPLAISPRPRAPTTISSSGDLPAPAASSFGDLLLLRLTRELLRRSPSRPRTGRVLLQMASDGGSYNGSRPRRHRTTILQTFSTHSASEGSVAASSAVGSVAGPVSTQTWGRGHGRRGPSRGLTDRRLESGQRWNVKVIGGTGIGESGAQFVSHMDIVSKLHCKI
ncbi:hypothetical protein Taro_016027, partial [Colocasia esculenta]|nr:hypothetical protein [Colocasia esculenta]